TRSQRRQLVARPLRRPRGLRRRRSEGRGRPVLGLQGQLAPGAHPLDGGRDPLGRALRGLQLARRGLVPARGRGLARRRAAGSLHHPLRRPAGERPGPPLLRGREATLEPLASVAVGRPVKGPFAYLVPPELEGRLQRGQRLLVPFGRGRALGFYLGPGRAPEGGGALKPVSALLGRRPPCPTTCWRWSSSRPATTATR